MILREITDPASLAAIAPQWAELAERVQNRCPFVAPEFLLPYLNDVGPRYRYRVLTAWEGDRLVGLAPLFERSARKLGLRFTTLSFPVFGTSPPFDLLIELARDDVAAEFVAHWARARDWDLLELDKVPESSPTGRLLRAATQRHAMTMNSEVSWNAMFVPIEGTWEEYWMSLKKDVRNQSKRARRRCEEAGSTRVVAFPGDDLPMDRMVEFVTEVTAKSWKTQGEEESRRLLIDLLKELARHDMLDVRFVTIDERPVAYLVNIDYQGRLNAFHTAYDLGYMWHGPSFLLLEESIHESFRRGNDRYSLLGDAKQHIQRWTRHAEPHARIQLIPSGLRATCKAAIYRRSHQWRVARSKRLTEDQKNAAKDAAREQEE